MSAPVPASVESQTSQNKLTSESTSVEGTEMVGSDTMDSKIDNKSATTATVAKTMDARNAETASEGTATPPPQDASLNGYSSDNSMSSNEGAIDVSKLDPATLMIRIKAQVEYYFSAQNLSRDAYMKSQMGSDGYIPIAVIAEFKKVKKLITDDLTKIVEAIADSKICSLNEEKTAIKAAWKRPARTTIILRDVQEGTTEEDISKLFDGTEFNIVSVRPDVGNTWFVQLDNEEDAKQATLHLFSVKLNGQPVKARLKSENILRSTAPTWQPTGSFQPGAAGQGQAFFPGFQPGMQFQPNAGYAPGGWDPRMQFNGSEWTGEQGASTTAQSAAQGQSQQQQRSPRQGGGAGSRNAANQPNNNSKRAVGAKGKGQKDSSKGNSSNKNKAGGNANNNSGNPKEASTSNKEATTTQQPNTKPSGQTKTTSKKEKSGLAATGSSVQTSNTTNGGNSSAAGRKKKTTVNSSSAGAQSLAPKKVKTPVFQPQDFPSLPMGKIALDDETTTAANPSATEPAKTVASVVAAAAATSAPAVEKQAAEGAVKASSTDNSAPTVAQIVAQGNQSGVERAPVAAVAKTLANSGSQAAAVASPTPSQPEHEETPAQVEDSESPLPSAAATSAPTPPSMSTWAAAVAKNAAAAAPQVQARATPSAFKPVSDGAKAAHARSLKSAGAAKKQNKSNKQVAESTEATVASQAQSDLPRPRRGWEQPGLPQVVPREVKQPKEAVPASTSAPKSSKAKSGKERSGSKSDNKRTPGNGDASAAQPSLAASSSKASPSAAVEPAKGVWGAKSFVQVIKEKPDALPTTSVTTSWADAGEDDRTFGEVQDLDKNADSNPDAKRGGNMKFFASTGEHVANLDGNWREQARNHRREEEARRRNTSTHN